jgi:hypothetical protein
MSLETKDDEWQPVVKWEYRRFHFDPHGFKGLRLYNFISNRWRVRIFSGSGERDKLSLPNELGAEGWELIDDDSSIFKRRIS